MDDQIVFKQDFGNNGSMLITLTPSDNFVAYFADNGQWEIVAVEDTFRGAVDALDARLDVCNAAIYQEAAGPGWTKGFARAALSVIMASAVVYLIVADRLLSLPTGQRVLTMLLIAILIALVFQIEEICNGR